MLTETQKKAVLLFLDVISASLPAWTPVRIFIAGVVPDCDEIGGNSIASIHVDVDTTSVQISLWDDACDAPVYVDMPDHPLLDGWIMGILTTMKHDCPKAAKQRVKELGGGKFGLERAVAEILAQAATVYLTLEDGELRVKLVLDGGCDQSDIPVAVEVSALVDFEKVKHIFFPSGDMVTRQLRPRLKKDGKQLS